MPKVHAVVVGSDMSAQTKFETQLREFVAKNGIHDRVHFANKTLAVAPYLAAIDVLVQNSQVSHSMDIFFSCVPISMVCYDGTVCTMYVYNVVCIFPTWAEY